MLCVGRCLHDNPPIDATQFALRAKRQSRKEAHMVGLLFLSIVAGNVVADYLSYSLIFH